MLGTFFIILAAIVLLGGIIRRRRVQHTVQSGRPIVGDELLRSILRDSEENHEDEEPLDEDEIRAAEDEFWEENWDDPDAWRG